MRFLAKKLAMAFSARNVILSHQCQQIRIRRILLRPSCSTYSTGFNDRLKKSISHPSPGSTSFGRAFNEDLVGQLTRGQIDNLTRELGHPDDWQLIYRLKAMPLAQALSKLKLLLTFSLAFGTPTSAVLHHLGMLEADLGWFLLGATAFSLCTLCAYSYFSTKLIGVLSLHKPTGFLRLGMLNFWGSRINLLVRPSNIFPPDDLCDTRKRTVRVGLIGDADHPEYTKMMSLFLTSVTGHISDPKLFHKYIGNFWIPKA